MTGKLWVRLRLKSLGLVALAGILAATACTGDAESPVAAPLVLAASPTTASGQTQTPANDAIAPGAAPGETTSTTNDQMATAGPYWPGWAKTDCAAYTRRPAEFCEAMKDAEVAEPGEVVTSLTAITQHNEDLVWSGTRGESRLLVVTWSSFIDRTSPGGSYDPANGFRVGASMVSSRDVFVTVVPELRKFCQASGPFADEALRIEQLLGLAPNDGKDSRGKDRAFVELWVDPQYLFRPSPDPETSDREAEIDFPRSDRFIKVSEEHVQWLKDFKSISYEETGLPWTRLGYTYDWGNPDSDVGLSEFVVSAGAMVEAYSITPTEEYC